MAETLAPKINPQIRPERPIPQPDVGGAIAGLVNMFASTELRGGQGSGPSSDAIEQGRLQGLSEGLMEASSLAARGYQSEADKLRRQVVLNYRLDGGDTTGQAYADIIRTTTGLEPEHVGLSSQEIARNELMSSPEFARKIAASYAALPNDATEEDRFNYAMGQIRNDEYLSSLVTNASLGWEQGRREGMIGLVTQFRQESLGALTLMAQNGGVLTPEQLLQAKVSWQQKVSFLRANKPQGLSSEQWRDIEDEITFTNAMIDQLEKMTGSQAYNEKQGQLAGAVSLDIYKAVDYLYREKKINALVASTLFKMDEASFIDLIETGTLAGFGDQAELAQLLESTLETGVPFEEQGVTTDPTLNPDASPFDQRVLDSVSGNDADKNYTTANDLARVNNAYSIENDENSRAAFTDNTIKMFASIYEMAVENGEYLKASEYKKFFGPEVLNRLERVGAIDPMRAQYLYAGAMEALDVQHVQAVGAFQKMLEGSIFSFNEKTGRLQIDQESLERAGIDSGVALRFRQAADEYYGGDLFGMIKDKGSRLQGTGSQVRELLKGSGIFQGMLSNLDMIESQAGIVKTLNDLRTTYRNKAQKYQAEITPEEAVTGATDTITGGGGGGAAISPEVPSREIFSSSGAPVLNEGFTFNTNGYAGPALAAAQAAGVDGGLFLALVNQESKFDPTAKSEAGAFGLTQVMPNTAANPGYGVRPLIDVDNPEEQLRFGAEYLGAMMDLFDGDVVKALIAYNAGPDNAAAFTGDWNSLPKPGETRPYVEKIIGTMQAEVYDSRPPVDMSTISVNPNMNPLISSMDGASSMAKDYAADRMSWVLSGPFQQLQANFGAPVTINDAIAKVGTTREQETPGSRHFHGDALDLDISGMSDEEKVRLVQAALDAGFQGFGLGNGILHIDMGSARSWAYGNNSFGGLPLEEVRGMIANGVIERPYYTAADSGSGDMIPFSDMRVPGPGYEDDYQAPVEFDPGEGRAKDLQEISSEAPRTSISPEPRPNPVESKTASQKATQGLSEQSLALLKKFDFDPSNVKVFQDEEEVRQAVDNGVVEEGDFVEVGGFIMVAQ